jgi:cytochrome c553
MIYKTKTISTLLLASTLAVTVFTGCGDTKHDENQKELSKASNAPKIEIVQNTNAHQIKVKEKDADKSQSKSYYLNYNIKSEYDENAKPANEDAAVRVKPRTAIEANMNIRSPYEKVQVSLLVRKLSKKFIVKCSACHNDYANGIIGPSLLGKDSDFIFNKIADFKSGKKSNPLMNDLIKMMSDDEIRDMANEVYKFNQEINKMRKK